MSRHLLVVAVVLLAGCTLVQPGGPGTTATPGDGLRATVVEVVDGDTIRVDLAGGDRETVRLLGVDAPEVSGGHDPAEYEGVPDTPTGEACLRDWGARAETYVRERLAGASVVVSTDPSADRRDRFGRLLAYVEDGDGSLNRALVEEGYARLYDTTFAERSTYADAERAARDAGRGLWACRSPRTADGSGLALVEVNADAVGRDGENLNDEYVVLENQGEAVLSLDGWQVVDEAGRSYAFPAGFELGPGERVTLHSGAGTDGGGHLYWDARGPVWNNDGDVVSVVDETGVVVARWAY